MKPSPRLRRWLIRLVVTAVLVALFLTLLPLGVQAGTEWWLKKQGVDTTIENVDINLFTGIARIVNARGENATGDGFNIGRAEVELRWRSLFESRLHLLRAELVDTQLDIRQSQDSLVSVLGLELDRFASDEPEPEEDEEPSALHYGLDRMTLSAVDVQWHAPDFTESIRLDTGGALDFVSWTPDEPVPVNIHAALAGGDMAISGALRPFAERLSAELALQVRDIDIGVFAPLLRVAGIESVAGVLNTDLTSILRVEDGGYSLHVSGPLTYAGGSVDLGEAGSHAASLDWAGTVRVDGQGEDLDLDVNGLLKASGIDVKLPELALQEPALQWEGHVRLNQTAGGMQVASEGNLNGEPLALSMTPEDGDALQVDRVAPRGDIIVKYAQAADGSRLDFDTKLESPGWSVALGEANYAGDALRLVARGGLTLGGSSELNADVDLTAAALALQPDVVTRINGEQLGWQGKLDLGLQAPYPTATDGVLTADAIDVAFEAGSVRQGKMRWQGKLDYSVAAAGQIDANGKASVADTAVAVKVVDAEDAAAAPLNLNVEQQSVSWDGAVTVRLPQAEQEATRIDGDGALDLAGTSVVQKAGDVVQLETDADALRYGGKWQIGLGLRETSATDQEPGGKAVALSRDAFEGDGELTLKGGRFRQPGTISSTASEIAYKGLWTIGLTTKPAGQQAEPTTATTLNIPGTLSASRLAWDLPGTTAGSLDSLRWRGDLTADLTERTAYSARGEATTEGLAVSLPDAGYDLRNARLVWNGLVNQPAVTAPGVPNLDGAINLQQFSVIDRRLERELAGFDSLNVTELKGEGDQRIALAALEIDNPAIMERVNYGKNPDRVLRLASLDLINIQFTDLNRLDIESIDASNAVGWVARDKDGVWEFSPWFAEETGSSSDSSDNNEATAQADTAPQGTQPDAPFIFNIGRISLNGDSGIRIRDYAVSPRFSQKLEKLNLSLTELQNADPAAPAQLSLSADIGPRGSVALSGPLQIFADEPSFDLKGRIEAVDLTPLSSYTAGAIGHDIRQGTVSADVALVSKAGELDSNAELKLSKMKLSRAEQGEGLEGSLGMPLNQALALLRDRDDNIELNLPITGDIENPDFSPRDVVRQAVLKAIQFAVLNFYSPLGVVFAADKLIDIATAVRFDPVTFEPGNTRLNSDDEKYLDKLAKLMNDRPAVEIVVCGYSTLADRPARIQQIEDEKNIFEKVRDVTDDRTPEEIVTDEDLRELAGARVDAVADYLIEQGIDKNRLVACGEKLESGEDAKPRVEFGF